MKENMVDLLREGAHSPQNLTNYFVSMPHAAQMFNILCRLSHANTMA